MKPCLFPKNGSVGFFQYKHLIRHDADISGKNPAADKLDIISFKRDGACGVFKVDGNDPVTVYEAVKEAVDYAREGNGPSIVECMTFRHQGHYCGDPANYRPASYMEEAHKKDAIPNMRKRLLEGIATEEEVLAVEKAVEEEMEAAYQFANESAYPDPSEATTDVYFSDNERSVVR